MCDLNSVKTGDVLLFSGNSPTGFLLRTFVSTEWNHSGIAVRLKTIDGRKVVSLTEEGELYIYETNTGARQDDVSQTKVVGAGFSRLSWVLAKYNKIAVRRLRDVFRTEDLARLTMEFSEQKRGHKFPSGSGPFLSVWLGIPLTDKTSREKEMFCSELMAHYYKYCVGSQYVKITGHSFSGKLSDLFGSDCPSSEDMFTPHHYSTDMTANSPILENKQEIVHRAYADLLYVILQPLIIILFIMLIVWMTLPK
jgi:hypothetical protein